MADTQDRLRFTLADRYLIERELGKGGMATVFLARDIKHDRQVAIKVLHPELSASIGSDRFEREIKLAAKLQHPHILGLYDSGSADNLLFYVMPFVEGESLRDRLEREGQLPIEDAIEIVLEVADALGYAHAQGIIHRDIKPENILLPKGGHALVADFGIARAASEAGAQKLTQTGMAIGTPMYMAPEQATGDQIAPNADLYSLGCVLYELLAGEPPFSGKNSQALMARHAMEAVPSIRIIRPTVSEEIEDAIFASMAKTPADRPKDAAHFAELLGMQLGSTSTRRAAIRHTSSRRVPTAATRGYAPPPRPWWKRPDFMVASVVMLVAASLAVWKLLPASGKGKNTAALSPDELARSKRVAVLYFTYPESNADLGPVADGLTEALITSLRTAQLDVISRNGVLPFRRTDTPTDSIARKLEVATVVHGSIAPEGADRVRVTTWLTDAQGNDLGQRTNFAIPRDSLTTAESRVAGEASQKLREQLGVKIELADTRARTGNQAAWTLFRQGENARNDAEQAASKEAAKAVPLLVSADSLLQRAAAADPAWVDPIIVRGEVALARARLESGEKRLPWIKAAREVADQAVVMDAGNARGLALRGTVEFAEYRALSPTDPSRPALLKAAEGDLNTATQTDPTLAAAFATLSTIQYEHKDVATALLMAIRAYTADRYLTNSDVVLNRLFYASYDTQSFGEAQKWCAEGERRFPANPTFTLCHLWLLITPDAKRDVPEAWRLAVKLDSLYSGAPENVRAFQSHWARILVGGAIGKKVSGAPSPLLDSARAVLVRARADKTIDPTRELPGYEAVMRAQMGDLDEAIRLLKEYVANNPDHSFTVNGNIHWWWTELRSKPEFQSLLAQHH